jgi:hypothetical protein
MMNRKAYRDHYMREKKEGAYLILDNSAHEFTAGAQATNLLKHASEVKSNEVVVPDHLFKSMETLSKAKEFFTFAAKTELPVPKLMLVPQGEDYKDYKSCLFGLMMQWARHHKVYPEIFTQPPTVGVSKDYEIWEGGVPKILRDDILPLVENDGVEVHLLGWGRQLWVLGDMASEFPWIRSTDSAKPFCYAKAGIRLKAGGKVPEYPTRPLNYFSWVLTEEELALAKANASVFATLAQGGPGASSGLHRQETETQDRPVRRF